MGPGRGRATTLTPASGLSAPAAGTSQMLGPYAPATSLGHTPNLRTSDQEPHPRSVPEAQISWISGKIGNCGRLSRGKRINKRQYIHTVKCSAEKMNARGMV